MNDILGVTWLGSSGRIHGDTGLSVGQCFSGGEQVTQGVAVNGRSQKVNRLCGVHARMADTSLTSAAGATSEN